MFHDFDAPSEAWGLGHARAACMTTSYFILFRAIHAVRSNRYVCLRALMVADLTRVSSLPQPQQHPMPTEHRSPRLALALSWEVSVSESRTGR